MAQMTTSAPFVGPLVLAQRWGLDPKTVRAAIERDQIPATTIGRKLLIPVAWIEEQERAGSSTVKN